MKLQHQIGGHPNVTSDESGTLVIKPASPREIAFYQLLHSTPAPSRSACIPPVNQHLGDEQKGDAPLIKRELLLGHLKRFLPRFYGTLKVQHPDEANGAQPECIILSNLSTSYTRPSIIDIKLGTVLYDASDSSLSEEKKRKMEEKMKVRSSVKTGAAITGFQTWDGRKGEFTSLSREECGKLKPEELAGAFGKFIPHPDSEAPPPTDTASTHHTDLLRTLHALLQTLSHLHALLSHLEIRFIGASLLIIYEGDPRQLHNAWHAVDVGESRGDGLEDDEYKMDGGMGDDDEEEEEDVEDDAGKGKPSFFSHVFGKFGADAQGAQGFGLLDGSPPPTPRRRRSQPTHSQPSSDHQTTNHQDTDEEEEEEDAERIPDADAHERAARPFTIRLIDFAHTRLADGEGPDEGVLLGLRTVMELVRGRIGELERPEGREVVNEQKMEESVGV